MALPLFCPREETRLSDFVVVPASNGFVPTLVVASDPAITPIGTDDLIPAIPDEDVLPVVSDGPDLVVSP